MRNVSRFYPLSTLTVALVVYLSLFNPAEAGLDNISTWDKLAHCIMYAGTSAVLWYERLLNVTDPSESRTCGTVLLTVLFPTALGGVLELLQEHCTLCRSGEWGDFLADSAGVAAGAVITATVIRPLVRHRLRSKR